MLPSRGLSSSTLRALASSNNEPTLLDQWWWLEGADAPQHVTSIAERTCLLNNARTYRCRTTCFGTGAEAQLRAHATTVRSRRFRGRDARIDRSDDLTHDEEDAHHQWRFAEYYTIPGHPRPIPITTESQKLFLYEECSDLPFDLRNLTFQNRGFFYHGMGAGAIKDALATIARLHKLSRLDAFSALRNVSESGDSFWPESVPPTTILSTHQQSLLEQGLAKARSDCVDGDGASPLAGLLEKYNLNPSRRDRQHVSFVLRNKMTLGAHASTGVQLGLKAAALRVASAILAPDIDPRVSNNTRNPVPVEILSIRRFYAFINVVQDLANEELVSIGEPSLAEFSSEFVLIALGQAAESAVNCAHILKNVPDHIVRLLIADIIDNHSNTAHDVMDYIDKPPIQNHPLAIQLWQPAPQPPTPNELEAYGSLVLAVKEGLAEQDFQNHAASLLRLMGYPWPRLSTFNAVKAAISLYHCGPSITAAFARNHAQTSSRQQARDDFAAAANAGNWEAAEEAESHMHPEDCQKLYETTIPNYPEWAPAVYVGNVQVNTLDAFVSEPIIEGRAYGASAEAIKAWKFKLMHFHPSSEPAISSTATSSEPAASDTAASGTTNAQRKQVAASNAAASGTTNAQRKRPLTSTE